MLQNAYFLAKIGADTAENEQDFAEISPKLATTLRVHHGLGDSGLAGPRIGQDRSLRAAQLAHELRDKLARRARLQTDAARSDKL